MRDMVTCFSEHAVRISETTCSSYVNQDQPCLVSNLNLAPSVPNAVVFVYKTTLLSEQKQLMITVAWCRNQLGQGGLSINFGDGPSTSFKLNTFSRLFRKKKGQKSIQVDSLNVDVYWDLSSATYHSGPEPVDGYYVVVVVDSELALALGDLDIAQEAATKRLKTEFLLLSKSVLVSRREHYSGNPLYSTKAQFCDSGVSHEIMIRCSEDHEKLKQPVLYVSIDKRTVIKVRRLQWNFRGNQTVFVDGLLVDLMWDVHDWFYNPVSGSAVFMFKTRSGGESRLWLEEKLLGQKDQESVEFSLLIYASKSS